MLQTPRPSNTRLSTVAAHQFYYKWKKTNRINKRMQQYAIPVADSFDGSPDQQQLDDNFRDQQFLARRHRRAMLKVPAGSVCANCESIDSTDDWRTRPADVAHLCLVCGEFWKVGVLRPCDVTVCCDCVALRYGAVL